MWRGLFLPLLHGGRRTMNSKDISALPVKVTVARIISHRYEENESGAVTAKPSTGAADPSEYYSSESYLSDNKHLRPSSWDHRTAGADIIETTTGATIPLVSDGMQSPPAVGWVIMLMSGDSESGYRWTLYGMPRGTQQSPTRVHQ